MPFAGTLGMTLLSETEPIAYWDRGVRLLSLKIVKRLAIDFNLFFLQSELAKLRELKGMTQFVFGTCSTSEFETSLVEFGDQDFWPCENIDVRCSDRSKPWVISSSVENYLPTWLSEHDYQSRISAKKRLTNVVHIAKRRSVEIAVEDVYQNSIRISSVLLHYLA